MLKHFISFQMKAGFGILGGRERERERERERGSFNLLNK